jgi:hypothetical protein
MSDPTADHAHSSEGRPAPGTGAADSSLGGYIRVHERPPAFEGVDGQPYTVSLEVEKVASLTAPWHGYLLFPRWAETGVGIVGHVETSTLATGLDAASVRTVLEALPLGEVKELLDAAIREREVWNTTPDGPAVDGGLDDAP